MTSWKILTCATVAVAGLVGCWLLYPREIPPAINSFQAHTARPREVSSIVDEYNFKIDNQDAIGKLIEVECGGTFVVSADLPERPIYTMTSVKVVPRLIGSPESTFRLVDFEFDTYTAFQFDQRTDPQRLKGKTKSINVRWAPGEYIAHYYIEDMEFGPDRSEPKYTQHFIGEGRLLVHPSPDGNPCGRAQLQNGDDYARATDPSHGGK